MPSTGTSPPAPAPSLRQRRSSTSSTSNLLSTAAASAESSLLSTAKAAETTISHALLLLWDDLPAWRRDNAYIVRGYRHTSNSLLGSLHSLSYLHNESVNIWSHLLGAVGFAVGGGVLHTVIAPRYESASPADLAVFACFFAGAFCCLGMSATYHMLCNHSPAVARWGNKLDYTGIVLLIVGSYVPALYYGFCCHEGLLTVYLSAVSPHPPHP